MKVGDRVELLKSGIWYDVVRLYPADFGDLGSEDWAELTTVGTGQPARWKVGQLRSLIRSEGSVSDRISDRPLDFQILNLSHPGVLAMVQARNAIYCGRPCPGKGLAGSPMANPFVVGKDGDRDDVCDKFAGLMWEQIRRADHRDSLYAALAWLAKVASQGRPIRVACWCAPKRCHCEALREGVKHILERAL